MESIQERQWHHRTAQDALQQLVSDERAGLAPLEVERRQARFGVNGLPKRVGNGVLRRLLTQFQQPLVYLLMAAGVVTLVLREWVDAAVILGVVLLNATIGFLQESKAAKAIEALARTLRTNAEVIRAGRRQTVSSDSLVPGDVVLLQSGDRVPADLRLLSTRELRIDESALTGESLPVQKESVELPLTTILPERRNMAYSTTLVTYGVGTGVVVATGVNTEIGRLSELIAETTELQTPLTRRIAEVSQVLLWTILGLATVTFAVGVARGESATEMFLAAVALSVGAIPEGLPAAVTIVLAIGVARMAARRAVIRKLPAVETLGSTTVVCSDKTGTLTENRMTVLEIWAGGELFAVPGWAANPRGLFQRNGSEIAPRQAPALVACLKASVLCGDARRVARGEDQQVQGDPTEVALLEVAEKAGLAVEELQRSEPRRDAIPFESQHRYMATLHGDRTVYLKGAVEQIVERCDTLLDANGLPQALDRSRMFEISESMASKGLRVLAIARRELPPDATSLSHTDVATGLTLLGMQGMMDPPRAEAIVAVATCKTAGIRVKMITGDHAVTARAIAEQVGILTTGPSSQAAPEIYTGTQLAAISDHDLLDVAERTDVFARVTPEQKLRLVRALQARGHVVAMTGDGVNDGPALKQANIGIAMGLGGTEVAKEAADVVLTDDHFATIEAAIEEGRGVFDNLTKFLVWTLPTNLGEGMVILAAILLGTTLPILPLQILWINLTTSVLLGLTLAFEPKERGIMLRSPRDPRRPLLTNELLGRIVLVGSLLLLASFGLFEWALHHGATLEVARTTAVSVFVVGEMFYLLNCRSLRDSLWTVGLFSNVWVWLGIGAMAVLQWLYVYHPLMNRLFHSAPLSPGDWGVVLMASFCIYVVIGIEKWLRRGARLEETRSEAVLPLGVRSIGTAELERRAPRGAVGS